MSLLSGQTALVTGAGRGIGKAIALTLAAQGAHVVCAARTESELRKVAGRIRREGGSAMAIRTDVTMHQDVRSLMTGSLKDRLDILVLNAGRGMGKDKSLVVDSDPCGVARHSGMQSDWCLSLRSRGDPVSAQLAGWQDHRDRLRCPTATIATAIRVRGGEERPVGACAELGGRTEGRSRRCERDHPRASAQGTHAHAR